MPSTPLLKIKDILNGEFTSKSVLNLNLKKQILFENRYNKPQLNKNKSY